MGREADKRYPLLIPAMFDAHFPLLKYAFSTRQFRPVILGQGIEVLETGLKYTNNDMCWPLAMMIGQVVDALGSGKYDADEVYLLMPTVGDACRGCNYYDLLKKAVIKAGYTKTKVLNMNLKHIAEDSCLSVTPAMVWKAMFGLFYGDMLMLLVQQTRPYEKNKGDSDRLRTWWIKKLGREIALSEGLTVMKLVKRFRDIAQSFAAIERSDSKKIQIALVGELYTKYCHTGNWDIVKFIEEQGCESFTNGLSWYVLYYIDAQLTKLSPPESIAYMGIGRMLGALQRKMIHEIRRAGFFSLPELRTLKNEAKSMINLSFSVGDGWLIGAEAVGYISHGRKKVLAVQPFGCMPSHIFGRGIYSSLARKTGGQIVSIDMDSSGTKINAYNRARMLIDT